MNLTLNQVSTKIGQVINANEMVAEVVAGVDPVDYLSNKELNYPCFFYTCFRSVNDRPNKANRYTFKFLLCEVEQVAEQAKKNQQDLRSDLVGVLNDVLRALGSFEYSYDFEVGDVTNVEFLSEQFKEQVFAVSADVEVKVWCDTGSCDLPAIPNLKIQKSMRLDLIAVGGETDFIRTELVDKYIIGVYKDGNGLAPMLTSGMPVNKAFVYTAAIGKIEFAIPCERGETIYINYREI